MSSLYDNVCKDHFNSIHDKLDDIRDTVHRIDKKAYRNTVIINAMLWTFGVLFTSGLGALVLVYL